MNEKRYDVIVTPFAEQSLQQIDDYLRQETWFQDEVDEWETSMENQLQSLSIFPAKHPFVRNTIWSKEGVRFFPFNGYNIYFWIDEAKGKVFITDVVHQRMNQEARMIEAMLNFYRNLTSTDID